MRDVRAVLARNGGRPVEDVEERVAVSTTHLGLVARLIAPLVAVAALQGGRLDLRIDALRWQDVLGVPYPLSVPTQTLDGPLRLSGSAPEAITEAVAQSFGVSRRVLWGNVGSSANSAAKLIGDARPDLAERARSAADELLVDPRLDGGRLRSGPDFRRRSCCLIYRLAGDRSAACVDCVLVGPETANGPGQLS